MTYDFFISYSKKDSDFVNKIYERLVGIGYRVWIDTEFIIGGDAYKKRIYRGIKESESFLFISSANSNNSKWTVKEIGVADSCEIPIIPVRIDDSDYNEEVAIDLINLNHVDLSRIDGTEEKIDEFMTSIQKIRPLDESKRLTPKEKAVTLEFLSLLVKAYEEGDKASQFNVAFCYQRGEGVPPSLVEATKWYRRAAAQGHAEAQLNLGVGYWEGRGVPLDKDEASRWFHKAADQGYVLAQYNLGIYYDVVLQDMKEAFKWYRKAAEQGYASAQYNLGIYYDNGKGVLPDKEEAFKWYQRAAEQGHASAQYNLGVCYWEGRGVSPDKDEASRWFRKAADQGDADAQYNLGIYYEVVRQDIEEAIRWHRKAAEQGNEQAKNRLRNLGDA